MDLRWEACYVSWLCWLLLIKGLQCSVLCSLRNTVGDCQSLLPIPVGHRVVCLRCRVLIHWTLNQTFILASFGMWNLLPVRAPTFRYACNQATAYNVSNCIYHRPQIIDVYKRKAKQLWMSTWLCSPKSPLQRSSSLRKVSKWISNHKYLFLQLVYQVTD